VSIAQEDLRPLGDFRQAAHRERWVISQDGLKLFVRDYGPPQSALTPVVCLPGLTRCTRDFDDVARHLADKPRRRRRVLSIDMRGRGRSDYDRDARNYDVRREAMDALDVITAAGLDRVVVIGTSRGGINAMVMAVMRPGVLAAVVLNDVGPRIEAQGLMRIISQLRRMPQPRNWEEAVQLMRQMFQDSFTGLSQADWVRFTEAIFRDDGGRPRPDFDPGVIRSLNAEDIADGQVAELWPLFDALKACPVLTIRGANSDLLSAKTVEEMAARHPDFASITVPGRGHAPFLNEPVALEAIDELLARIDR
jgi:pimeloyl-ACP methyl ester carboxylesterase